MIGCDSGLLRRQARGLRRPGDLGRPRPRHRRRRPPRPAGDPRRRRLAHHRAVGVRQRLHPRRPDRGRGVPPRGRRRRAIIEPDGMPAWRTFVLPDRRGHHPRHLGPDGPGRHRQPRLLGGRRRGCPTSTACSRSSRARRGEPIYALPWSFIVKGAAIPIGLARRALDELLAIAPGKLVFPEFAMLGDLDHLHDRLARSRALIGSAPHADPRRRGRRRGTRSSAPASSSRRAGPTSDWRWSTAPLPAAPRSTSSSTPPRRPPSSGGSPIDRAHRDIVTASQHLVVNDRVYGMVGRVLMGKPAGVIMV